MRLGIDATPALRQYAGVGRFARGVLSGLAGLDHRNSYTLIATGKARFATEDTVVPDGSRWVRLPISERLATIGWQRLRAWPPPTLFARDLSLYFTPDYALPPLGGVRGILTVHDLSFLTHPECAEEALRRYLSTVVPRSVRAAAAVIAVTETTAAAVRAQLPGGPPIHVVPNGVDPAFHGVRAIDRDAAEAALLSRFGLGSGYLLAVSTLEPRKNYVRLLQAFALARGRIARAARSGGGDAERQGEPVQLVIAGREGWLYEPIFREYARLGLRGSVRFISRFDDRDLLLLLRGARAFIYPSLYEGFGIPPLEAMAAGVPVAASTGGAIPEVLGDAALLFDPLDVEAMAGAIERVLLDTELRDELVRRGTARAATYTWEASAMALLRVFETVAA